jgi:hypothetical protein
MGEGGWGRLDLGTNNISGWTSPCYLHRLRAHEGGTTSAPGFSLLGAQCAQPVIHHFVPFFFGVQSKYACADVAPSAMFLFSGYALLCHIQLAACCA